MANDSEHLLAECKKIEENCLYTAQTHFEMASDKGKRAKAWLVLLPSIVSASSGLAVAIGAPGWIGAFAAVSGVVSGVATFLGVGKESSAHETAGKRPTQSRDEARVLGETYSRDLSAQQLAVEVRALGNRYRAYVASLPVTDGRAFEKARAKIKSGAFAFDADAVAKPPASIPPSLTASTKDSGH